MATPSLLAWVSLTPVIISLSGLIFHFIFRRELQGIFFALGLILSQFINEVIKTTCTLLQMCDSHGWLSSYSLYMFFFATYLTSLLFSRRHVILHLITWSLACFTMYSTVYLGYHTVAQVFAGAALGVFLGMVWFWVVNNVLNAYFKIIEESVFGRMFYVKDTSHIPNLLKFEYEKARAERKRVASISQV